MQAAVVVPAPSPGAGEILTCPSVGLLCAVALAIVGFRRLQGRILRALGPVFVPILFMQPVELDETVFVATVIVSCATRVGVGSLSFLSVGHGACCRACGHVDTRFGGVRLRPLWSFRSQSF
jgi:hypothetical protein